MPRVSILLTVHNGERFLAEAMKSILNQSYSDLELIVIDDGSTDRSRAILEGYRRSDDRVRYFRERNLGIGASLNKACEFSGGEYIAIMDHDDIAFPDRISKEVTFLDNHPTVALVGGAIAYVDERGKPTGFIVRNPTRDEDIKRTLLVGSCIAHPTVMMRREVFHAVNGYRKAFSRAQDYDLWLRLAERFELANLPESIIYYRIHPNQGSIRYAEHQAMCSVAAQASAKIRRRTGRDPMNGVGRVTHDVLVKLGVTAEMVRIGLLDSYAWWAAHMLHSGYTRKPVSYFAQVLTSTPASSILSQQLMATVSVPKG
jgi:glycosyltransferase involved in cell wall biosynthesis